MAPATRGCGSSLDIGGASSIPRLDTGAPGPAGPGELIIRRQNESGERAERTLGAGEPVVVTWQEDASLVLIG